jgi:hypothetical protein
MFQTWVARQELPATGVVAGGETTTPFGGTSGSCHPNALERVHRHLIRDLAHFRFCDLPQQLLPLRFQRVRFAGRLPVRFDSLLIFDFC